MFKLTNRQQRRSLWVLLVGIFLLVVLLIPTTSWVKSRTKEKAAQHNSQLSPLIMIPGSSATKNRFDTLVKLLNQGSATKHSLLKVEVYNSGKITYTGKIRRGDTEPIIVVAFENNHDGYSNIKKQAKMFNEAFEQLVQTYKFNNFKAFGHSNGGLIWTVWLEKYYDEADGAKIKTLMTLGTPYNFSESSVSNKTQMLSDLIADREMIPSSLTVLSVMGTETYNSDGLVPEGSVEAGKYIYQKVAKHYTTMTVAGTDAQHSNLPQNQQIVSLIKEYILNQNGNRPGSKNRSNRQNQLSSN